MKRAVVLAGGLGMRLRPYTAVLPKPLMPVGDRPVLDIVIRQLRHHEFDRITIATGYLAELIEAFFRAGDDHGIAIDYHREHTPLGTAGAIASIEDLTAPFLVMNGDVLTDIDYTELMKQHLETEAAATIATITRDIQVSLGVLHFADPHQPDRLTSYEEKPHFEFEASMGIYAFSPRILEYMKPGECLDFPDLIKRLLDAGEIVRAFRSDCYWLDIGRHDDYEQALEEFERMRDRLIPDDTPERRSGSDRRLDPRRQEKGNRRDEEAERRQLPAVAEDGASLPSLSESPLLRRVEP
ncbi:MAG: NDP-mannose synthase [Solirubrobacteraceae bacterium]|jgi:NDP-sugar pyrophosphorylase family protein|nr:NDP-mannose synthase [Solirubrobacteraceae bacterium]